MPRGVYDRNKVIKKRKKRKERKEESALTIFNSAVKNFMIVTGMSEIDSIGFIGSSIFEASKKKKK